MFSLQFFTLCCSQTLFSYFISQYLLAIKNHKVQKDTTSAILASNFINGIQNPYIKNKLRSYTTQNLSELYSFALKEDQKQKIRELAFGTNSSQQQTIAYCDINAIKGSGCYKCGNDEHFIKDCPQNRDNSKSYNGLETPNMMYTRQDTIRSGKVSELGHKTVGIQVTIGHI